MTFSTHVALYNHLSGRIEVAEKEELTDVMADFKCIFHLSSDRPAYLGPPVSSFPE